MRDLSKMRDRYLRDPRPVRLGNLASNLLRLSNWLQNRRPDEAVVQLMCEIAWLLEWSGDLESKELADMQREICRWRLVWPLDTARSILAFRTHQMSGRLLELSGLLEEGES
jgi:hypothetical protein